MSFKVNTYRIKFKFLYRRSVLFLFINAEHVPQVRSITMPPEVLRPNTLLTNLVLDSNARGQGYNTCDDTFVYMSDTTNPGIVVYDASRDSAWRLGHPAMFPETDWGTFRVSFHLTTFKCFFNRAKGAFLNKYFFVKSRKKTEIFLNQVISYFCTFICISIYFSIIMNPVY